MGNPHYVIFTDEMATRQGFRGYGPEQGYDFLREAILKNDFLPRGIHLDIDEIFVNDGAKSDTGNIQELIRWDNSIGVTDPIYPVYIDSNVMIGRAGTVEDGKWSNVVYLPCNAENGFVPQVPGGVGELMKFLSETVKYPEAAEKAGKQGRVIATFVVEKDGTVSGAKVVKSVSPELDAEALRVINAMPNWKPGMQSGKAVRVKYTIPITFRLQGNDKKDVEKRNRQQKAR